MFLRCLLCQAKFRFSLEVNLRTKNFSNTQAVSPLYIRYNNIIRMENFIYIRVHIQEFEFSLQPISKFNTTPIPHQPLYIHINFDTFI